MLLTALTACATPPTDGPVPVGGAGPGEPVTTGHAVTVLDDGDGPELCLGAMAMSYPPQCGGPALIGWDWSAHSGDHEDAAGVRWGSFVVTGWYDPKQDRFTVRTAVAPDDATPARVDDALERLVTPCEAPEGGWSVPDPARTTSTALDAAVGTAMRLPGYSAVWVDQSPNPTEDPDRMNDPELLILNVKVTEDAAGAEAALREQWGGMLCVATAERTEKELMTIADEITADHVGMLSAAPDGITGTVRVDVVYDDGTAQRAYDRAYGAGIVQVVSALTPVD
ncbi:hypothetical protein GCM10022383_25520 [Microbacterium soli]|uniref:Uncharacterized protein n=2 Tax=Microbacterium soli TaxID=446075 RepID=A0ABP7NGT3_9MICO